MFLARFQITALVQSLHEAVLKFHGVGTSLMRNFDINFSVNRTLWIGSKTYGIGFPRDCLP